MIRIENTMDEPPATYIYNDYIPDIFSTLALKIKYLLISFLNIMGLRVGNWLKYLFVGLGPLNAASVYEEAVIEVRALFSP